MDNNEGLRASIEKLIFLSKKLNISISDAIYHLSPEQIDDIAKDMNVTRDEAIAILKKSVGTEEPDEKGYEHISIAFYTKKGAN